MKTELTKEQSQHLIDLGVPKEKASIVVVKEIYDWQGNAVKKPKEIIHKNPFRPAVMGFETFDEHYIFKLEDFLNGEILPHEIEHRSCISIKWNFITEKWDVDYDCTQGSWHGADELIDALYQHTCWYYGEFLKSETK